MKNEIARMMDALQSGEMSLDEVARRFRERSWPRRPRQEPKDYLEMAEAAQQDPEPYIPGTFDDVVAAYDQGKISDAEYTVLSEAVAESKRSEDLQSE